MLNSRSPQSVVPWSRTPPEPGPRRIDSQLRKGAWLQRSFTLSTTCHAVARGSPACHVGALAELEAFSKGGSAKADRLSTINSPKLLNHFLKLRAEHVHASIGVENRDREVVRGPWSVVRSLWSYSFTTSICLSSTWPVKRSNRHACQAVGRRGDRRRVHPVVLLPLDDKPDPNLTRG